MTDTHTTATATARTASTMSTTADSELESAIRREGRHMSRLRRRDLTLAIAFPAILLLAWEIAVRTGVLDGRLFSPPSAIAVQGWELIASGELWVHSIPTILRLVLGFVIGAVAGTLVGLLMGVWRPVKAALEPTFTALYALPKIAILPLLLLIFGLTETPKILSVVISVFFVVQINTLSGIMQIDPRITEAARAYKATGWRLFRYVLLPAALPSIMTSLRVSAGMAVIVITAVEFVASNTGLGYLIWNSWQLFQPSTMFVGLITVAIIGALMTGLVVLLERVLLPWRYSNRSTRKVKK